MVDAGSGKNRPHDFENPGLERHECQERLSREGDLSAETSVMIRSQPGMGERGRYVQRAYGENRVQG